MNCWYGFYQSSQVYLKHLFLHSSSLRILLINDSEHVQQTVSEPNSTRVLKQRFAGLIFLLNSTVACLFYEPGTRRKWIQQMILFLNIKIFQHLLRSISIYFCYNKQKKLKSRNSIFKTDCFFLLNCIFQKFY